MAAATGDAVLSACGRYRWRLSRCWRPGPTVCWIMLNPSTATAEADDPTIRAVTAFTRGWGYGGLVVVNLYPLRTASAAACRRWAAEAHEGRDAAAQALLAQNLAVVADEARRAGLVVAAWGAAARDQAWIAQVIAAATGGARILHCLGTTASGAPKHPLARGRHRFAIDQRPLPWAATAPVVP